MRAWVQTGQMGATNSAGLPEITGNMGAIDNDRGALKGAFYKASYNVYGCPVSEWANRNPTLFSASYSNNIYGNSSTVMPNSINIPIAVYLGAPA